MTTALANPALNGATGLKWANDNPDAASKCLMLFADGASLRELERECSANIRTIRAYLRSSGVWGACTKEIAKTARHAAQQLADRLAVEAHDIPIENVAAALKTVTDVANALDGTPQTIIEHRHTHSIAEPTIDAIKAFKARMAGHQTIEAEIIQESPEPIATPLPTQPDWEPGEMV